MTDYDYRVNNAIRNHRKAYVNISIASNNYVIKRSLAIFFILSAKSNRAIRNRITQCINYSPIIRLTKLYIIPCNPQSDLSGRLGSFFLPQNLRGTSQLVAFLLETWSRFSLYVNNKHLN